MRIAIIGDMITMSTGYGVDTLEMLTELKNRGHDVANISVQYSGYPFSINGINIYGGQTHEEIVRSALQFKADVAIHFRDLWYGTKYTRYPYHIYRQLHSHGIKFIQYSPVQNSDMPKEFDDMIDESDLTIFPTKWAYDYYRKRYDNVGYVPHSVQHGIERLYISRDERPFSLPSGMMMMNVGFAQDWRKQTPLVLLLLSMYLKHDSSAFAYLHTQITSYYDNMYYAIHLGIPKDKAIFPPSTDPGNYLHNASVDALNKLYNSADVYCNFSSSEGFDHTTLEAASLGIPVLVTDTPVRREVLSDFNNVHFIKSYQWIPTPVSWFDYMPDMNEALDTMLKISETGFKKAPPKFKKEYTIKNTINRLLTEIALLGIAKR